MFIAYLSGGCVGLALGYLLGYRKGEYKGLTKGPTRPFFNGQKKKFRVIRGEKK
jgi:hypothetical protein